jgi:uncharacterized protein YjbJ (UPF0337 family)
MTDKSNDRIDGKSDELMGRAKSAVGELQGDEQTKSEGEAQETSGKAKQGLADAKDKVDNLVKKVATGTHARNARGGPSLARLYLARVALGCR